MVRLVGAIVAVVGVIGMAACSSDWPGNCDFRTQGITAVRGQCFAWSGEKTGDFAAYCTGTLGGTYSTEACATAEVVGRCETDERFGLFLTNYYYAPTYTTATAQTHCASKPQCTQTTCMFFGP
jgi:hypothetical protein